MKFEWASTLESVEAKARRPGTGFEEVGARIGELSNVDKDVLEFALDEVAAVS